MREIRTSGSTGRGWKRTYGSRTWHRRESKAEETHTVPLRAPRHLLTLPSMIDPGMAPPGKHVMSIFVQYAPSDLDGVWDETKREAFGDAVIDTLAQYAPNLPGAILHRQVLTPWDIDREMGLTQGNIFHGELTLHQLFSMRPVAGWADFTTPLRNYYQCGSGTHPGGGITGASGRLAAFRILGERPR